MPKFPNQKIRSGIPTVRSQLPPAMESHRPGSPRPACRPHSLDPARVRERARIRLLAEKIPPAYKGIWLSELGPHIRNPRDFKALVEILDQSPPPPGASRNWAKDFCRSLSQMAGKYGTENLPHIMCAGVILFGKIFWSANVERMSRDYKGLLDHFGFEVFARICETVKQESALRALIQQMANIKQAHKRSRPFLAALTKTKEFADRHRNVSLEDLIEGVFGSAEIRGFIKKHGLESYTEEITRIKSVREKYNEKDFPYIKAAGLIAFLLIAGYAIKMGVDKFHRPVDPAAPCADFSAEDILSEVEFVDQRTDRLKPTMDEVRNVLASLSYAHTHGIRKVVMLNTLLVNEKGETVTGKYNRETQTLYLSRIVQVLSFAELAETICHEVGHHVRYRLAELDHELSAWPDDWSLQGEDRFAQTFAYLALRGLLPEWEFFDRYKLGRPTSEQLASVEGLFCGSAFNNLYYLAMSAKIYLDTGDFDRFIAVFGRLTNFDFTVVVPLEIRNYWALASGAYQHFFLPTLLGDLAKVRDHLLFMRIGKSRLVEAAAYVGTELNDQAAASRLLAIAEELEQS